jgi:hypothetical protein
MDLILRHFRWVRHKLNDAQLAARVQVLNELLKMINSPELQDWLYFITLDELWLYLSTDYEITSLPESEIPLKSGK